ncbi:MULTISPECIES: HU family DNA-binding protein [Acidiphilium]|uniref:HU family DNA-binding protein n=1 Tax=Acidiphilium TaxID=522 RepID=UPI00257D8A8D|nr:MULTISPECIES: HU family DNA-binding protein [Acidiphilium]HQT86406.1 HU family DNA-binding protein [Acidiphilium rubrum]
MENSTEIADAVADCMADDLLEAIVGALLQTGKSILPGFSTFAVHETKARSGINPRTAELIKIKAGKSVSFRVTPGLPRPVSSPANAQGTVSCVAVRSISSRP